MWAIARPTVLVKVAPVSMRSGRNCEAEKRRRSATDAPLAHAGKTVELSALPWNSGIAP